MSERIVTIGADVISARPVKEEAEVLLLTTSADGPIALLAPSAHDRGDLSLWIDAHLTQLRTLLDRHKAILFRGFHVDRVDAFQAFLHSLGAELLEYAERSTPRTSVRGRIYTSTEYPPTEEILMHNENAYSVVWPRRIAFCCLETAREGGGTPIADSRDVFRRIDPSIRKQFIEKQVMYVRNYGLGVDLSWQNAFQTSLPEKVESFCRDHNIACEWFDQGAGLHTEQIRPAALRLEATGEIVWFNQAHLFHVSSLPSGIRNAMTSIFPAHRLPRNVFYGDKSSIDEDAISEIRRAYKDAELLIEWQRGDVLLLDNLFYAHGRMPFKGDRRVIVAMDSGVITGTAPVVQA